MNNPVVSIFNNAKGAKTIIGAGVLISPHFVLTCHHVTGSKKHLRVIVSYPHKQVYENANIVYSCPSLDFSILELRDEYSNYLSLGSSCDLIDNTVARIECPHESKNIYLGSLKRNTGTSANKLDSISFIFEGKEVLAKGTSGSPVIQENKIVALHWGGGLREHRFKSLCIPINLIKNKLWQQRHRWELYEGEINL